MLLLLLSSACESPLPESERRARGAVSFACARPRVPTECVSVYSSPRAVRVSEQSGAAAAATAAGSSERERERERNRGGAGTPADGRGAVAQQLLSARSGGLYAERLGR